MAHIPEFGAVVRSPAAKGRLYNAGLAVLTKDPESPALPDYVTTAASPTGRVKLEVEWYHSSYEAYGKKANGDIFDSWTNARTDFGAVGDGIVDDTAALQAALDSTGDTSEAVLYLPPGTYRVTNLTWLGGGSNSNPIGGRMVGDSPWNTTIVYDGETGGNLITHDNWYGGFERITFDANGKAARLIETPAVFRTNGHYRDCVFRGASLAGIEFGLEANGIAEQQIARCWFIDCATGIRTDSANALDVFVWDSIFLNCGTSLDGASGNYSAFQNLFVGSKVRDAYATSNYFTFQDNVSVGSTQFVRIDNLASPTLQRNRIFFPTSASAVETRSAPTTVSIDNEYWLGGDSIGIDHTFGPGAVLSVGDLSDVAEPHRAQPAYEPITRSEATFGQAQYPTDDTDPVARIRLPALPEWNTNVVSDFLRTPHAAVLQEAIDAAHAGGSHRPVVHVGRGKRGLFGATITMPAGGTVQLVGDGMQHAATSAYQYTRARNGHNDDRPFVRIVGPSKCGVHFLSFHSNAAYGTGFQIEYDGNPSEVAARTARPARTVIDHALLIGTWRTAIRVDGCEAHHIVGRDIGISGSDIGYWITGPGSLGANKGTLEIVSAGNSSMNEMVRMEAGARTLLGASWYEGQAPLRNVFREACEFTYMGGRTNFRANPGECGWHIEANDARVNLINQDFAPYPGENRLAPQLGFITAANDLAPYVWVTGASEVSVIGGRHASGDPITPRYLNAGIGSGADVFKNRDPFAAERPYGLADDASAYALRVASAIRQARSRAPFEVLDDGREHDVMLDRVSAADCGAGIVVAPLAAEPYSFAPPRQLDARIIVGGPFGYEDDGKATPYGRGHNGLARPTYEVGEKVPLLARMDERFETAMSVEFFHEPVDGGARITLGTPPRAYFWDDRIHTGNAQDGYRPVNNNHHFGTVAFWADFDLAGLAPGRHRVGVRATGADGTVTEDTREIWIVAALPVCTVTIQSPAPGATSASRDVQFTVTPEAGLELADLRILHGRRSTIRPVARGQTTYNFDADSGVDADLRVIVWDEFGIPHEARQRFVAA